MSQTAERQLELLRANLGIILRRAYAQKKLIQENGRKGLTDDLRLGDISEIISNIEYMTGVTLEDKDDG